MSNVLGPVALAFLCLMVSACGGSSGIEPLPQDSDEPGWHEGQLTHDGLERAFRFYIPEDLSERAPVVVLLHGGTQSMDALFRPNAGGSQAWTDVADREGFVLLVPNGTNIDTGAPEGDNQRWNDCREATDAAVTGSTADDVGFLTTLIDWAEDRFNAPPNRLYVTGVSNGGQMAFRLAIERPGRIAAIAVFIAQLPVDSVCPAPTAPLPVFMANGTEDPITPFEGGEANGRGAVLSAESTRDVWGQANGTDTTRRTIEELPDRDPDDGSRIVCEDDPAPDADVRFCRVEGGGHAMPSIAYPLPRWIQRIVGAQNRDAEGAELAWSFLSRQRR